MLSSDILSQLTELKKEIRSSKDIAQGTVRGTAGRYGFVSLDDGRDAFLNPEQMDRVFHNDRVEVTVTQNDKEQYEAKLEKLIHSPLKQVAGRYCIKGKGHFIICEYQQHSRWIFVPPKARANAKEGHYVTGRIVQHPYETGKSQAKIINDLGKENNAETAKRFTLSLFQLFENFPKEVQEQAKKLESQAITEKAGFEDLCHLPFVTIDSASTRDMDDALAVEKQENGWHLYVAIADPGAEIEMGSPIDNIAMRRAHTLYFPGKPIPMLPENLSTGRYSLLSGEKRFALVCKLIIDQDGVVSQHEFTQAIISSKAKLSYQQVSALLNDAPFTLPETLDDATPFKDQLLELKACTDQLHQQRKAKQIVSDNRDDFAFQINQEGKLIAIEKLERTEAHTIVEESMIITNQCAGKFLAEHQAGLFTCHHGFREERREDIEKLLEEKLGDNHVKNTHELSGYIRLIKHLQSDESLSGLMAIQQRFLQGSEVSLEAGPHFGLGAEHYATITSPIRRYQDLYNQRTIHQLLNKHKTSRLKTKWHEQLKETISNNRLASRHMEQWLIAEFMQSQVGQNFKGYIALLTNQGVGVRLHDTGIEGFIAGKKEDKDKPDAEFDKISFNNQRMELTWNDKDLFLEQDVEVKLSAVDMERKKLVFEWI